MEMVPAVRRHLLNLPVTESYVNDRVYADKMMGVAKGGKLWSAIEGTGKRAIVVRDAGQWSPRDQVQTNEWPLLAIDYWADCSRNAQGDAVAYDCIVNARAMHRALDPFLHGVRNERWGAFGSSPGLLVITSALFDGPLHQTKDESHGGSAYGMQLSDTVCVVTVRYGLQVVH